MIKKDELKLIDAYFRAANYLSVGQLYLQDNPLLRRPLALSDIKPNVVGHWGTAPGQNFVYVHLNRIIKKYDLNMIYVSGPGHGGEAIVANTYLEGSYSKIYPNITEDEEGLKKLFKQFSFPKGISSHVAPETPGSINEGGELGYSLAHAYGAVLDNPTLIAACVIGDGEAETGPLAASLQINKIINPKTDGVVLPILHLNGYKIANPTILSRITPIELDSYFKGCGYQPYYVSGDNPISMHKQMASTLDKIVTKIKKIKQDAKLGKIERPLWPMIILKTKKGWTGPREVDGKSIEGSFRSHQVPIVVNKDNPKNLKILEKWLLSYRPEELFDENGSLRQELKKLVPPSNKTMGLNPNANGGLLLKDLRLPNFRDYAVEFDKHGNIMAEDMIEVGKYLRDVIELNHNEANFRIFAPDETKSNRLGYIFEKTNRKWNAKIKVDDESLSREGAVVDSILSEHVCEGLLEGYLLTGRHGLFNSYEAFIRIVDSMVSQHAKWLKVANEIPWRRPISSLNLVLSSHIWQQDHNGFTHQDPGFLNHMVTKKADTVRIYLPPDANCLLSCVDHCLRSKNYINVIVASKHPRFQWLSMNEAIAHCSQGISIFKWASNDEDNNPDIVMASSGDTPTLETLAAVSILRKHFPKLKIRVVNVVDLMKLQSNLEHPHGLSDEDYDAIFTVDKPIIFAFHGYANLIHELTHNRHNKNIHVRGYKEEGTITTPFDMRVQNEIDRFNLVILALKHIPKLKDKSSELIQECKNKLIEHSEYIKEYGDDLPEVKNFVWEDINKD